MSYVVTRNSLGLIAENYSISILIVTIGV
jgi:hypothetical protein